jgi:Gluconate 2-dehydrogenase subunit 3
MSNALDGVRPLFRAVVTTAVPEARNHTADAWAELEQIVDRALSERPPSVQRQVRAFLRLLNVIALATRARGFAQLDDAQRTRLLERLAGSRLLLVRRGVWGVRTLAFMGYYARADAAREIGYRASPAGWGARPDDRPRARHGGAGLHR